MCPWLVSLCSWVTHTHTHSHTHTLAGLPSLGGFASEDLAADNSAALPDAAATMSTPKRVSMNQLANQLGDGSVLVEWDLLGACVALV